MHEPRGEEELERAMEEFLRATEDFIVSWTEAVRRFGGGPAAMSAIRERRETPPRPAPWDFAMQPPAAVHPLWDRDLDV